MKLPKSASIVVVGGGVSGCAIAWKLASRGVRDIVLIEKDTLGNGSTGRCGAGCRMQWGAMRNCQLAQFSIQFFEQANEVLEYHRDIEFDQSGYLIVAANEEEATQFKKNVELQNSLGIESNYLSPAQAQEIVPFIDTSQIVAATFCDKDGHLNPFHTTEAYALAAERLGVTILKHTAVTGIEARNGRITAVETTEGRVATPIVVNAAGGWSKQVGAMAGIELPVYVQRHQILVTEPLEPILRPMVMGFDYNIYIQQVPHGSIIMGRSDETEPLDLRATSGWRFLEEMTHTCGTLLPYLRSAKVLRQWAGHYCMTEDAQPIYGPVPELEGFYLACGFSGHGFMLAPATAQMITEMILGEPLTIDVSDLDIGRFERRELFHESSVV
ncbi:MAG TPA: FAD-binding oxidoreductase [Clostridia bacterium]|nr:FAD-binding oxidoreductase [Clostridia bacterium]